MDSCPFRQTRDSTSTAPPQSRDFRSIRRLRQAASNEEDAQGIVATLLPRIRRRILLLTRMDQDTDDLVAQCLVEIMEILPRFRGDSSLATWADKVTYRVAMRSLSRRRRKERTELPDSRSPEQTPFAAMPAAADSDPHRQAVTNALVDGLRRHLGTLPEPRRTSVVLRVLLGHSMKEVSPITGVPLETARSRVKKGLLELRRSASADPQFLDLLGRRGEVPR